MTVLISAPVTDELLAKFISDLTAKITAHDVKMGYVGDVHKFTITAQPGSKNIRIVKTGASGTHGSAYCFLDKATGYIYKPAGFKAPAKHARGSIHNEDGGMNCCGPYGVAYLR